MNSNKNQSILYRTESLLSYTRKLFVTHFAKYKLFNNFSYLEWPKMMSILKKLGYLSNEKIFLKIWYVFPLYHDLLFGSLHRELALPSLLHINQLIIYEIIFLYTYHMFSG